MLTRQEISYNRSEHIVLSPATSKQEVDSLTEQISSAFNSRLKGVLQEYWESGVESSQIEISLTIICDPLLLRRKQSTFGTTESSTSKSSGTDMGSKLE